MKLKSPMFWIYLVVILYLVSMLVYVSIEFFGGSDTNKISAFGSVLGGVGTIFAGFVAIYLFNDWRDQHNKQVDSDFIMKLYDCLFEMRQLSTRSVGFMRDYLTKQNKNDYAVDLKEHNNMLCHLIDFSALKLSDVAYVITTEDYQNKFSPQIKIITDDLYKLNKLYILFLQSENPSVVAPNYKGFIDLSEIDQELSDTLINLNERYRSFLVELKIYYKA